MGQQVVAAVAASMHISEIVFLRVGNNNCDTPGCGSYPSVAAGTWPAMTENRVIFIPHLYLMPP